MPATKRFDLETLQCLLSTGLADVLPQLIASFDSEPVGTRDTSLRFALGTERVWTLVLYSGLVDDVGWGAATPVWF